MGENSKVVKWACLLEGIVAGISSILYILKPELVLKASLRSNLSADQINTIYLMAPWFGIMTLAQAVLLFSAVPNYASCILSRRIIYLSLLTGEIGYFPIFYNFIQTVGIWEPSSIGTIVLLVFFFIWRLTCFFVKPAWFGDINLREESSKKSQ